MLEYKFVSNFLKRYSKFSFMGSLKNINKFLLRNIRKFEYIPNRTILADRKIPKTDTDQNLTYKFDFKAYVRYFLFFSPDDSPSKTMKNAFYFI